MVAISGLRQPSGVDGLESRQPAELSPATNHSVPMDRGNGSSTKSDLSSPKVSAKSKGEVDKSDNSDSVVAVVER